MTERILETLDSHGISMEDLRGQGYDNGSNMRGKQSGVQAKILHLNSRPFYVPCSSHSLNLIVNDAVGSCLGKVTFFDIVQHLFVFFSFSTQRWNVLPQFVKGIKTIKTSTERDNTSFRKLLEYRVTCISSNSNKNKSVSRVLLQKIDFKFVCCLITWFDVLSQIEITSKSL